MDTKTISRSLSSLNKGFRPASMTHTLSVKGQVGRATEGHREMNNTRILRVTEGEEVEDYEAHRSLIE